MRRPVPSFSCLLVPALLALAVAFPGALQAAGEPGSDSPFEELSGTWRGTGTIYSKDGNQDPIECKASYRAKNKGKKLTQEFECNSKPFDIDLRSRLSHNGGELGGGWFEKKREVSGRADGRLDSDTITLRLKTGGFKATLTASLSTCMQAVELVPEDSDIVRVAVKLKRDSC